MSKVFARSFTVAAALTALTAGCHPASDSSVQAVMPGQAFGQASQLSQEVFIYYANESDPLQADSDNRKGIADLMSQINDPYVQTAVSALNNDATAFPIFVNQDIAGLTAGLCSNSANSRVSVMIFTNVLTRQGQYQTCAAGQPVQTITEPQISTLYQQSDFQDFRYASAPLAHPKFLQLALALTQGRYSPATYSYSMVQKSHGSALHVLSVRMPAQYSVIENTPGGADQFKAAILAEAQSREAAMAQALQQRAANQPTAVQALSGVPGVAGTSAFNAQQQLTQDLQNYCAQHDVLKDDELKDDELKDDELKDDELKDDELGGSIMNEVFIADIAVKTTVQQNPAAAATVSGNSLLQDIYQAGQTIESWVPSVLAAQEGPSDASILVAAEQPPVGTTKEDWIQTFYNTDQGTDQMNFNTVFLESCQSYMTSDVQQFIANNSWTPNIGTLFTSDQRGIDTYATINYQSFLAGVDFTQPFGPQLAILLNGVANQTKGAAATTSTAN